MNMFEHLKKIETEPLQNVQGETADVGGVAAGMGTGLLTQQPTHVHLSVPWQTGAKPYSEAAAKRDSDGDGIPDYMDYYWGPGQHDPHHFG